MHTDYLSRYLADCGHPFFRFEHATLPFGGTLSLHATNTERWEGHMTTTETGHTVTFSAVSSVWWRRPGFMTLPQDMPENHQAFTRSEIHHTLGALWALLDCYWMNHPVAIQIASYKFEQLQRARRIGFEVPATLITTSLSDARQFLEQQPNHRGVYKVLTASLAVFRDSVTSPRTLPVELSVRTTPVSSSSLAQLMTLGPAPCQFQELLQKRREYRVTVIGEDVFTVSLEPDSGQANAPDWRHLAYVAPMRSVSLPSHLESKCLAYAKSYGLTFDTLDLAETSEGRVYFLEHNPSGQFLFIQRRLPKVHLLEAVAASLIRAHHS